MGELCINNRLRVLLSNSGALGVSDPGLRRVVGMGVVAVGQQDRPFARREAQRDLDVSNLATLEEGETDLVEFATDRPEPGFLQLSRSTSGSFKMLRSNRRLNRQAKAARYRAPCLRKRSVW